MLDTCEDCVVDAYAEGKIRERRLLEISRMKRAEQQAALDQKATATKRQTGAVTPLRLNRAADMLEAAANSDDAPLWTFSDVEVVALMRRIAGNREALDPYPKVKSAFEELIGGGNFKRFVDLRAKAEEKPPKITK